MAPSLPGRDTVLTTSPEIKTLLNTLHSENSKQENSIYRMYSQLHFLIYVLWNWNSRDAWDRYYDRFGNPFLRYTWYFFTCEIVWAFVSPIKRMDADR
jgi:surface polysaccharide O-acyltransferase-like enzyme